VALTKDTKLIRYGSGDDAQPLAYPIGAAQQLYSGAVALVSGSGTPAAGYLKNAATANLGTSDIVVGMVGDATGGAYSTGPGLPVPTASGDVWAEVLTGAFYFQSGTGADQLVVAGNGLPVYYGGESTTGPIACAVVGSPARPVLGIQVPQDPGIAGGSSPGAGYWPVIINPAKGRP
jgi:hypothetical protein